MTDLTTVIEAARKWADELANYIIDDTTKRGDDEDAKQYSEELDKVHAAIENLKRDTTINVYLTGDEEGPDLYGVIYDEEDGALESARENDGYAWRVPAQLYGDRAVRLDTDSEN